ncbi:MAG TPA: response regulator, partial [Anaerolineales bacterium]
GTTFFFTLPITREKHPGLERSETDWILTATPSRKTMLMVEPDLMLLNTVQRQLSQYEVVRVQRLANLPELIERYRPVALIIDRQSADDAELALSVPPDLPVITVQLSGQWHDAQTLGIRDFLLKPITRKQLFEAMDGLGQPVRSVLVVDDDPALVDLVSRMLQAGGTYRINKAWSGEEALTHLRREPADLVLLDWLKTGVTGLKVLEEMRNSPDLVDIPVIMLGGESPNLKMSTGGLDLRLIRTENASVAEVVKYLEILVGALPLRGLSDVEDVQLGPAMPTVPPAS